MSNSKHITRREFRRLYAYGDTEALADYSEKTDLKKTYKQHRRYSAQIDDDATRFTMPNSAFLFFLRRFKRAVK